ncbi:MAG: DUF4345 family protein, partial [Myxococcota bacterium]
MNVSTLNLDHALDVGARGALAVSGSILLAVGGSIFLGPLAYQAGMGVELPTDPTLLSDLRAMGGGLLGFGILLWAGALQRRWGLAAACAGAVLYLSYGLSRLFSIALDGLPSEVLVGSAV